VILLSDLAPPWRRFAQRWTASEPRRLVSIHVLALALSSD
jgi:hypothetical protein